MSNPDLQTLSDHIHDAYSITEKLALQQYSQALQRLKNLLELCQQEIDYNFTYFHTLF